MAEGGVGEHRFPGACASEDEAVCGGFGEVKPGSGAEFRESAEDQIGSGSGLVSR